MSFIVKGNSYGLFEKQVLSPDGITTDFPLNYRPGQTGAILVVYAGVIQEPGSSYNLIDGGRTLRFSFVPEGGQSIYVLYMGRELSIPTVIGNYPVHTNAIGDGITTTFNLPVTPVEPALMVYLDGVLSITTAEWVLSGDQVIFATAPANGVRIDFYIHGVERTDLITVDDGSITAAKLNLHYIFYTPGIFTFNGMSHSVPDFLTSKYMPAGGYYKLRLKFIVEFGDAADDTVRFSLPDGIINDSSGLVTGSVTLSTPSLIETGILRWAGDSLIDVKRPNSVDYTLGEEWTFEIDMTIDVV